MRFFLRISIISCLGFLLLGVFTKLNSEFNHSVIQVTPSALTSLSSTDPAASLPAKQNEAFSENDLIRALLVTGGCCHDYSFQMQALPEAVKKFASVEWDVVNAGGTAKQARISLYDNPNWAVGYDVVVYNTCFANTQDPEYIRKITNVHKAGVPAVVIHCAAHTYCTAEIDDWRQFLGVTSCSHDPKDQNSVQKIVKHPILQSMPDQWTTPPDELYVINKLWPTAQAIATSVSKVNGQTYPIAWVNQFGSARVFGTTYGHSAETFQDPVYLDMLGRGILWAVGRLEE
ncbi:MAG: ThuA domain-containing protein [Drouetiella hepatica Uher 2000/2452]|jgi:type 1 glutamine amidotransferase|uniref:ThuA domain-containing protein n=1 Tax=Drouetiella hepatica Uher 2000/2452 TaxID=904376 RepID=A0A951QD66_9CYAN|nr:ThuA domain-containing protein [Drouetiella hepatica Uher 2000/2452]